MTGAFIYGHEFEMAVSLEDLLFNLSGNMSITD
jgi:hypothetical protein